MAHASGNIRKLLNGRKVGVKCPLLPSFIEKRLSITYVQEDVIYVEQLYSEYVKFVSARTQNDRQAMSMITRARFCKVSTKYFQLYPTK